MEQKITNKYYFSTEGETEKAYLDHLEKLINREVDIVSKVSFYTKKSRPNSFVKSLKTIDKIKATHFFDYESFESEYRSRFENVLKSLKEAQRLGKSIVYQNGYSNLSFELWILLHKTDCNGSVANVKEYLQLINKAFQLQFAGLSEYKEERNFKKVLDKISINDVFAAVKRCKMIMKSNEDSERKQRAKYGYSYYLDNPATQWGSVIEEILDQSFSKNWHGRN